MSHHGMKLETKQDKSLLEEYLFLAVNKKLVRGI